MSLQKFNPEKLNFLFGINETRLIEKLALKKNPKPSLMQQAGKSLAKLALATATFADSAWVVCGSGNNGGDGLVAAFYLAEAGVNVYVTWLGDLDSASPDSIKAWRNLQKQKNIIYGSIFPDLTSQDIIIDALLGIGFNLDKESDDEIKDLLQQIYNSKAHCLIADNPSGLCVNTGFWQEDYCPEQQIQNASRTTLSFLTLKPGFFTASGKDASGTIWLDTLNSEKFHLTPKIFIENSKIDKPRLHDSHKGSFGDVLIIGGEKTKSLDMRGAVILASTSAIHNGAGKVFVYSQGEIFLPNQPEIMFCNKTKALGLLNHSTVVCGCGGGNFISEILSEVLKFSKKLVLDADALNRISESEELKELLKQRKSLNLSTILTPHPLEAARLLNISVEEIQRNRIKLTEKLSLLFQCTVILKGSGTIIASPEKNTFINFSGNGYLATAGTGDVLAGILGSFWNLENDSHKVARLGVFKHGNLADNWLKKNKQNKFLTANELAKEIIY